MPRNHWGQPGHSSCHSVSEQHLQRQEFDDHGPPRASCGREEFVGQAVELVGRRSWASHARRILIPSPRVPMPLSEVILVSRGVLLLGDILSPAFRPGCNCGWPFVSTDVARSAYLEQGTLWTSWESSELAKSSLHPRTRSQSRSDVRWSAGSIEFGVRDVPRPYIEFVT